MSDELTLKRISSSDLQIGPLRSSGQSSIGQGTTPSANRAAEPCGCDGSGWYVLAVPFGHPDFGKLQPCSCTLGTRAANAAAQRVRLLEQLSAELGGELAACTLDNYDPARAQASSAADEGEARASMQTALETCRAFVADPRGWLYLWGPTGVGKSHLAAATALATAKRLQLRASYASEPALMRYLREGYDRDSEGTIDERMQALIDCDLLVLDDLGTAYRKKRDGTDWADSQLFDLLNPRYQHHRLTIITSNLSVDDHETRVRSRILGRSSFHYCGREQMLLIVNADQRG